MSQNVTVAFVVFVIKFGVHFNNVLRQSDAIRYLEYGGIVAIGVRF